MHESENLYRRIVEQAEDVIFTLDNDCRFTSLNPAFERVLGFSRAEWIGRDVVDLLSDVERSEADTVLAQVTAKASPPLRRVSVSTRAGTTVVLEVSLSGQFDGDRLSGFIGFARDVTERQRVENELRRNERQLLESQRIACIGSWEMNLDSDVIHWSDEVYRLFGVDPDGEPMTYAHFLDFLSPAEQRQITEKMFALDADEQSEWEMSIVAADGREKILSCHARLVRDHNGRPAHLYASAQDVTATKRAEQMLRESEERFRFVASATHEVLWEWNTVTNETWWGEGLRTLFGHDPQLAGRDFAVECIHPDDRRPTLTSLDEAISAGENRWSCEYRFRRADGTYATVFDRAYIVREGTIPVRLVGAMMDITDRKQMQEQLAQANRVSSLGRIAASIAHEFNNVLMGVLPNLEVIRRRASADLAAPIEHITRSVRRGKRITDEILRFTRPAQPSLHCVDVTRLMASWLLEVSPLLGSNIALAMEVAPDLFISADAMQLSQVLTNLALNARDAMQSGGGRLTVRAEPLQSFNTLGFMSVTSPDRFVHFSVTDTGSGMTDEQLAHAFEPLFTTKKGGTGLGLAVSYQIVTSHEGYITARSIPGEGTTFHVLIPADSPVVEPVAEPLRVLPADLRVLIVEDEAAVSAGIRALLEMEDVLSREVDTGAAAVPAIEQYTPHAVILDIGLPDINGIEVYARIAERWPDLPVLFSSGHAAAAKLDTYLNLPNVGLIVKPYDLETLRTSLGALLQRSVN